MRCEKHPEKEALGFCSECGRGICEECLIELNNTKYCKECYNNSINSEVETTTNKTSNNLNQTLNQQKQVVGHYVDFKAITVGLIIVLILSILLAIIFSNDVDFFSYWMLLSFISDNPIESLYIPLVFIGALITGFLAGENPKKSILNGILTSLIGTIIIYLIIIQIFNAYAEILDNLTILTLLISMAVGALASFTGACLKIENLKSNIKLQWKPYILIGLILPIFLGFLHIYGLFLATLLASIYVGIRVNKSYENGIIHGIIIGSISSLFIFSIIIILSGFVYGFEVAIAYTLITLTIMIISGLFGAVGGFLGIQLNRHKTNSSSN